MQMSEFDREAILAQRQEELQRIQDKRALDKMLKDQSSRAADVDSVSRAAKRSCLSFSHRSIISRSHLHQVNILSEVPRKRRLGNLMNSKLNGRQRTRGNVYDHFVLQASSAKRMFNRTK
jgi:hypothetical protein